MAEAALHKSAGMIQFTAAAALASGEIVQAPDGRAGVVAGLKAAAINDTVSVYVSGIFDVLSASGTTFVVGAPVYWDTSASLAIAAPGATGDLYIGRATRAKVSGETVVRVDLNAPPSSFAQRGVFTTPAFTLDHADVGDFVCLNAVDNPTGMVLLAVFGEVTEAPAGSSEDQMVVELQDEDDNTLSVMTTTDTTPDAIGDIIQGTQTANGASTGAVLATIPAGTSAHFQVTQATAGTPAGKLRCRAILAPLL